MLDSWLCVLMATMLVVPASVFAQEGHVHSDIEFKYEGGAIVVEVGPEGAVFEGTFPLEGVERLFTTEPGFASEVAEGMGLFAGDQIVYDVTGPLGYWNDGFQPVPAGVQIRIVNQPPSPIVPDTVVSSTSGVQLGSFAPFRNRLGEADGSGEFHTDLEFYFESDSSPMTISPSWFGAYGIPLRLISDEPGIERSSSFYLVFNLGLEDEKFEAGVAQFAALVPEPSTASGLPLLLLVNGLRRRLVGRSRD